MTRTCIVCGARVRNENPKVQTCDTACGVAHEMGVPRDRAERMLSAGDSYDPERVFRPRTSCGRHIEPMSPGYYDSHTP